MPVSWSPGRVGVASGPCSRPSARLPCNARLVALASLGMGMAGDVLSLVAFAAGFIGLGVGVGLAIYHFGLGWFISRTSRVSLELAIRSAERHLTRQVERRHGRERRRRVLVEAGEAVPRGRHLGGRSRSSRW